MYKHTVTFVTAFLDLYEDRSSDKSIETCKKLFEKLAGSNIAICLYVSKTYEDMGIELEINFPNVKLMPLVNLEETLTYNIIMKENPILPIHRNIKHDTLNFLILMNAKSELVNNASIINPFNTKYFAWIDFSICHVLKNVDTVLSRLQLFSYSNLKDKMLLFPTPFTREQSSSYDIVTDVHWRFCGGFYIGDKDSIRNMFTLMKEYLPIFIKKTNTIVWEVNIWTFIERNTNWNIQTYYGNHDDSILNIPAEYISVVAGFTTIPSRINTCNLVIDSLINQVEHIYISICNNYKRFGVLSNIPNFLLNEPYKSKVTIVYSDDYGSATKYIGPLNKIDYSQWIFFCDDDQEYHSDIINKMKNNLSNFGVYQNRYNIVKTGSGGIVHGYVGNISHRSFLENLLIFPFPEAARMVDDQWMSIYYFLNDINIYPSGIEDYNNIFKILYNGHEQIGKDSLAGLGNRDLSIKELEQFFQVKFINDGIIIKTT